MVSSLFKTKPAANPGEELLQTSVTPLTIPALLADARARFQGNIVYEQKVAGRWERLTFEDTWRQASDFGAGLIALGLEQGDRVAIICENSLSWATGYFGISLAGGVAVPLYTELKKAELEDMIKRSGPRFVIAAERVIEKLGDLPGVEKLIVVGAAAAKSGKPLRFLRRGRPDVLPFDEVAAAATSESRSALEQCHVEPDDLASIVFTSGTTGGMKGVMLTHKNLTSNIEQIRRTLHLDEKDRIVQVLPMHHAFPFIIFLANCAFGGKLTFENDLVRVRDRVREVKPTLFLGVPALFEQMYRAIERRAEAEGRLELFQRGLRVVDVAKRRTGVNLGRLILREVHQQLGGSLRFVLSGGAALRPEVARNFLRLGLPILQGWGLTEASPVVATQRLYPKRFAFSNYYEDSVGSVGTPLDGVEVKLIDVPEKGIYVHLHGEGELIVRGPNVFAGYWQAPEETAEALADGWLRTGDLGRIDDEGNIRITGRSKYVIVLDSGEKVLPDELEERLALSELVQDICIMGHRIDRKKTLVAAIVYPSLEGLQAKLGDDALNEEAVRSAVQQEIETIGREFAQHKRVSEVTLTDAPLPKTAILKVARGQLPETFTFEIERWRETSAELSDLPASPPTEDEATG